ncbi:MAG: WYL domain-containing protein [Cyanobacteria bacterium P01_C01_bin.120]
MDYPFLRGLVHNYESRSEDVEDETVKNIRRVVRQIRSTFWLFREVRRYGADCIVIGPEDVRDRFAQDAIAMARHYLDEAP